MMEAATLGEAFARSECDEPLDSETKNHLRLHLDYLTNHLVVGPLLQTLCQKELISTKIKAEIKAKATSIEQAEALIEVINKGSKALFAALLEILETDKQYEVLRVIRTRHRDEGAVAKKQYPLLSNLKRHEDRVIESLRFEGSFLLNLVTKEAITQIQKEYLESIESRHNRAEELVSALQKGGNDDRMKSFMHVLQKTDQTHICSLILGQDVADVLSQKEREEMLPNMMTYVSALSEMELPVLVHLGAITEAQKGEIQNKASPTKRAELLLDVLMCRPRSALKKLQDHIKAETTKEEGIKSFGKYSKKAKEFQKSESRQSNQKIQREFGLDVGKCVFFISLLLVPRNVPLHGAEESRQGFEHKHELYIDMPSLFARDKLGQSSRRILIIGAAGSGKSTLLQYSCEQWGSGELWSQFAYIFNLTCRRLNTMVEKNTEICLLDLLLKHGPEIIDSDEAEVHKEILSNKPHVLIVVDGVDELSGWTEFSPDTTLPTRNIHKPAGILDLIYSLMVGDLMPESSVLFTSRPIDTIDLDLFDKTVKIFGFGRTSIESCLLALAKGNVNEQKAALQYLDHRPQLYLFCTLPLGCIMTGRVVLDELSQGSKDKAQHESINCATVLYIFVLLVFLKRRGQHTKNIKDRFEGVYFWCKTLLKMMKLAAWGMLRKSPRIIFSSQDIEEHSIDVDDLPCGLLDITTNDKDAMANPEYTSAAFLHYTIQEFLTALHIAITWKSEDIKLITSRKSAHQFNMVLLYLSGLLGNPLGKKLIRILDKQITEEMLDKRLTKLFDTLVVEYQGRWKYLPTLTKGGKGNSKLVKLQLIRCISESNQRDLVRKIDSLVLKAGVLDLTDMPGGLLPEHMPALVFYLTSSKKVTCLRLEPLYYSDLLKMRTPETERRLVSMIDTALLQSGLLTLHRLQLSEEEAVGLCTYVLSTKALQRVKRYTAVQLMKGITAENQAALVHVIDSCVLGCENRRREWQEGGLNLSFRSLTEDDVSALAHYVGLSPGITYLKLRECGVTDKGACQLASALETNNSLLTLGLYNNQITAQGGESIAAALKVNKTLTSLVLGGNQIKEGVESIAAALHVNRTLTDLYLGGNDISDVNVESLATALRHNTTLAALFLDVNKITDVGAKTLASALRKNLSLTKLDLQGNKITDVGADHLVAALRENLSLTVLWLNGNKLSSGKEKEMKEEFSDRVNFDCLVE